MRRSPFRVMAVYSFTLLVNAQVNVLTYKYDNARTGQNLNEPLLSPVNVNAAHFGRRFSHSVDGYLYGQPLYVAAVPMADGTLHDIIVVATAHDSVYAFDADDNVGKNSAPLWQASFINPSQGVTTVPWQDVNCSVINPEIGITGTPVIDPATFTVYFVASTKEVSGSGTPLYVHRLHALDIRSGQELSASPVEIQASMPGTGDGGATVTFVPQSYKQRAALLLANGVVYTAWSSHCDHAPYHGWIIGYRADTLQQAAVYNTTPNSTGASFWGGGAGPAADANGDLFAVSANGDFDELHFPPDLADSIIRLSPAAGLTVADYFTPYNQVDLEGQDLDLGSSGALLLPPEAGSDAHRNLVLVAGKEGRVYLVDRDQMGGFNSFTDAGALQTVTLGGQGVFGSSAYFSGNVYLSASGDQLRSFGIANAALTKSPVSSSSMVIANPGSSPIVSANGSSNGVVWAYELGDYNTLLHAFDAADLSKELYRDAVNAYTEFGVPTEADGKVYVGALNTLFVYGLFPPAPGNIAAVVNAASFNSSVAPGSLISIFGSNLAQATAFAGQIPLPISLADTSVSIDGVRAPLLYVSPGQINAQAPPQIQAGLATVVVTSSGSATPAISIPIAAAAPEIFTSSATRVLALNQDGTVNSAGNPTAAGSIVTVFLTGQGSLTTPAASIGNLPAALLYAGPAPQTVGVAQMNMRVPALPAGDYQLQVTLGGVASNSGVISVN
jgi:uncharacterized protein (TIGR03437 family)